MFVCNTIYKSLYGWILNYKNENSRNLDHEKFQEINEEDEKALEKFMNKNPEPRKTLADIITEKLTEKKTEIKTQFSDLESVQSLSEINPKVKVR